MKYLLIGLFAITLISCDYFNESETQSADATSLAAVDRSLSSLSDSQGSDVIARADDVDTFLKKYKIGEPKASEIKKLVLEKQKTSAIREVKYASASLSLPQAKAVVDTLFFIMHGEPLQ